MPQSIPDHKLSEKSIEDLVDAMTEMAAHGAEPGLKEAEDNQQKRAVAEEPPEVESAVRHANPEEFQTQLMRACLETKTHAHQFQAGRGFGHIALTLAKGHQNTLRKRRSQQKNLRTKQGKKIALNQRVLGSSEI